MDTLAYVESGMNDNECSAKGAFLKVFGGLDFSPFGTFNLGVLPSLGMDSWLLGSEEVDGRGENFEGAKWLENKLKEREPIGVSVL